MIVSGGSAGGGGGSPEVHDHLHCFERVKLQVVKTASDSQLFNLLSVSRLITILNEADDCGVICKLEELDRGVFRWSLDIRNKIYDALSNDSIMSSHNKTALAIFLNILEKSRYLLKQFLI